MREWSKKGCHLEHCYELYALTNADLYSGKGAHAHARIIERWSAMRTSLVTRVQSVRIYARHMSARSALAAAGAPRARDGRCAADPRGAYAVVARAGDAPPGRDCQRARGDRAGAASLLVRALPELEHADMALYAAVTRRLHPVSRDDGASARTRTTSAPRRAPRNLRTLGLPAKTGGADGTRTRGLRRDRPAL